MINAITIVDNFHSKMLDKTHLHELFNKFIITVDQNAFTLQGTSKEIKELRETASEWLPILESCLAPGMKVNIKKKSQKISR
jgi:hypothetical protein